MKNLYFGKFGKNLYFGKNPCFRQNRYFRDGALAFLLAFAAYIMVAITPAQAETRWVSDVPIMDEFEIIVDLGFSFDSPHGRIIGIFATSDADMSMVKGFYDTALHALGWIWQNDGQNDGQNGGWYRGSERLSLTRADTSFGSVWRLMVQPR